MNGLREIQRMNRAGYNRTYAGSESTGPSGGPDARLSVTERNWYSARYGAKPSVLSRVRDWFSNPWNARKANDVAFAASMAIAVAVIVYAILR